MDCYSEQHGGWPGRAEDIGSKYRFPFGCPVSITKTDGREWVYDTINEFGIALGAVKSSNGYTLLLVSLRGNVPLPRLHVQPLLLESPEGATTTVLELEKLEPIEGEDGTLITIRLHKASYEFHIYSQNT